MEYQEVNKEKTLEVIPSNKSEFKVIQKAPRMYRVVLLNDDYTPMDFVVEILKVIFGLGEEVAISVMLQVHQKGKGVCGIFTHEIAETKVFQVSQCARGHEYPLLCSMEPDTLSA